MIPSHTQPPILPSPSEFTEDDLNFHHPWSASDFKQHLNTVGDYIVNYHDQLNNSNQQGDENANNQTIHHVCSRVQPGYLQKLLPNHAPENGESFDDILKDVSEKITKGVTHWQHPNFYSVSI